jgi:hypothetical protein
MVNESGNVVNFQSPLKKRKKLAPASVIHERSKDPSGRLVNAQ